MHSETHSPLFSGNQSNGNRAIFGQFEIKTGKLISNFGARIEHYKLNDFNETDSDRLIIIAKKIANQIFTTYK